MTAWVRSMTTWIDARTPRERSLVLLTGGALVWALWSGLLMDPLLAKRDALAAGLTETVEAVQELESRSRELTRRLAESPDADNRRAEARLRAEVEDLEARLGNFELGVVAASEAVRVLEELLDREQDLALVRLTTRPAAPAFPDTGEVERDSPTALWRHDLELELEGTYLGSLRYLRAIQAQPWRIYWDELHLEVTEHPTARVTLRLHTLSHGEAWIGV